MIHPSMLSNTNLLIGFYASNCLSSEDITTVIFFLRCYNISEHRDLKDSKRETFNSVWLCCCDRQEMPSIIELRFNKLLV